MPLKEPLMPATFSQVVVFNVLGMGLGRRPASVHDFRRGARSLNHLAAYVGGLELPTLAWLGLGLATEARGLPRADPPAASWATIGPPLGEAPSISGFAAAFETLNRHLGDHGQAAIDLGGPGLKGDARENTAKHFQDLQAATPNKSAGLVRVTFEPASHSPLSPHGIARGLKAFDDALGLWLDQNRERTDLLVLLTSACGRDPVFTAGDSATLEAVPFLAFSPALPSGVSLGPLAGFEALTATIADALGCPTTSDASVLPAIVG